MMWTLWWQPGKDLFGKRTWLKSTTVVKWAVVSLSGNTELINFSYPGLSHFPKTICTIMYVVVFILFFHVAKRFKYKYEYKWFIFRFCWLIFQPIIILEDWISFSSVPFICHPVVKAFQEYSEPEDANSSSPQRRAPTAGEDEAVVLPLGENTLTHNLGIPVLVVCTKASKYWQPISSIYDW